MYHLKCVSAALCSALSVLFPGLENVNLSASLFIHRTLNKCTLRMHLELMDSDALYSALGVSLNSTLSDQDSCGI